MCARILTHVARYRALRDRQEVAEAGRSQASSPINGCPIAFVPLRAQRQRFGNALHAGWTDVWKSGFIVEHLATYYLVQPQTKLFCTRSADVCVQIPTSIAQEINAVAAKDRRRQLVFTTLADMITTEDANMRPMPSTRYLAHRFPL